MRLKRDIWVYAEQNCFLEDSFGILKTIEHYSLEKNSRGKSEYHIKFSDFINVSDMCPEEVEITLAVRGISKVFYNAHLGPQFRNAAMSPMYFKQHYRQLKFVK